MRCLIYLVGDYIEQVHYVDLATNLRQRIGKKRKVEVIRITWTLSPPPVCLWLYSRWDIERVGWSWSKPRLVLLIQPKDSSPQSLVFLAIRELIQVALENSSILSGRISYRQLVSQRRCQLINMFYKTLSNLTVTIVLRMLYFFIQTQWL